MSKNFCPRCYGIQRLWIRSIKKIVVLLTIVLFAAAPSRAQDTMQLVYSTDGAPFSWEEGGQMQGILVDILTEAIQARMGIPVSHKGYPWPRAQLMVKNGKADAFATIPTPERLTYTEVSSEPVILVAFTLFTQKGTPKLEALQNVKTIADLKGFKIGHYLGSGWAQLKLKNMNVEWAPARGSTLKKLARGRVDVFVDASQGVRYNIKRLELQDQIVEIPNVLDSSPFNLCIGKDSSFVKILPQFNETLKAMQEDGTLDKITNNYNYITPKARLGLSGRAAAKLR